MLETASRSTNSSSVSYKVKFKRINPKEPVPLADFELDFNTLPFEGAYEEITPNSEGSHNQPKSFEHYKRSFDPNRFMANRQIGFLIDSGFFAASRGESTDPLFGITSGQGLGALGEFNLGLDPMYLKRSDDGFVPAPGILDYLTSRSLQTMLPEIKGQLSLVNSIIELKDFVSLPRTLLGIKNFASRWLLPYFKAGNFRFNKASTLRQLLRTTSDGYLQAKFNVLPLLSDISGIRTALLQNERRVNDLITRQGRVQRRHFAYVWQELPFDQDTYGPFTCPSPSPWGQPYYGNTNLNREVYPDPSLFHAEIVYNYNYTQYQVEHARQLALMDALGLNLNPQIIWNAIPWTFVIDWVAGVSQFLGQFKQSAMKPVINILSYQWSVKRRRRIIVSARVGSGQSDYHLLTPPWSVAGIVTESAYRRHVGYPSTSSILSSGLSSTEFSLGAALVLSRSSHRRHRQR